MAGLLADLKNCEASKDQDCISLAVEESPIAGETASSNGSGKPAPGISKEDQAIAILFSNPDILKKDIAKKLKTNVRLLGSDRMPKFDRAWQSAKAKSGKAGNLNVSGVDGIHVDEQPDN